MVRNGQIDRDRDNSEEERLFSKIFWSVSVFFFVWYLGGLVLMSPWISKEWRQMVSGWGDCVFLVLVALLTWMNARRDAGARRVALSMLGILLISGSIEMFGVRSGFPFGRYAYTDLMGGKIGGILPWVIPVCWLILVFNAYVIISIIFSGQKRRGIISILLTATVVTLVDLNLEPFAVHTMQYWIWEMKDSAYYGVPWTNFLGWFMIATGLTGGLNRIFDSSCWRISTGWISWTLLGSIQFFFALMNMQSGRVLPAGVALGVTCCLSLGLIGCHRHMRLKS